MVITFMAAASVFAQGIKPDFKYVKGGTFNMGSTSGLSGERPVHSVTVSSFYMCDHEVTQKEYRDVTGYSPSYFSGDNRPVEQVNWFDAIEYCNALSWKEGLEPCYLINGSNVTFAFWANGYRLPTEAEWEFAARGGNNSNGYTYSGSDSLENVAWYGNPNDETHNIKEKKPNELGLYDMSGNVYEWCWDYCGDYTSSSQTNPIGPSTGMYRIIRGGNWRGEADGCRVANRTIVNPARTFNNIGFRVVRSAL